MNDANPNYADDVRLLYPSKYLGAPDLRGRTVTLAIESVKVEEVVGEDGKSQKAVVRFAKAGKPWIINKTNLRRIASLHGHKASAWAGKQVSLYPTACKGADGTVVECVRAMPSKSYSYTRSDKEYAIADAGRSVRDCKPIKPGPQNLPKSKADTPEAQPDPPDQAVPAEQPASVESEEESIPE